MAIVERCNLFDKEWEFSSFVQWFNQSSKDFREKFLLSVFNHYGPRSVEFLFVLQGIVYWCIKKYNVVDIVNDDISDIVNNCIVKVLESVHQFDKNKGKLANYLHTICRGVITCYNSKQRTLQKNFSDYSAVEEESTDGGDILEDVLSRELEHRITMYQQVFGFDKEEAYRIALWDFFVEYKEQSLDVDCIDVVLFVLSKEMKIPFIVLKSIKDKYSEDVLFLFYLFAGRKVKFPSLTKLYKIIKFAQELTKEKDNPDLVKSGKVLTKFLESFVKESESKSSS